MKRLTAHVSKAWLGLLSLLGLSLIVGLALQAGAVLADGSPFIENWAGAASAFFYFLPNGGSTINSNVAEVAANDGKIVQLNLPAFPSASPSGGPNLQSTTLYGFGTYESRMKTVDCSSQPNSGVVSGFFTYLNDGTDQNGNGISDNSEIDFEWLCAEPNVIWMTLWTDYQDSPLAMKRVYRELDLATGTIRRTCYSEGFGTCTEDLTGNLAEGSPALIAPLTGYNSATTYYTYGFTWLPDRITLYVYNPADNQKIILWDYRGPTTRITQRSAYYMFNTWHTNNWTPPSLPGAVEQPNSMRSLNLDWVSYDMNALPPTSTPCPTCPTATPTATRTPTPMPNGPNLAAGKIATGSIPPGSPELITDGVKDTNYFAGQDLGAQWIQLDLGQAFNLTQVKLWHYFGDGRTYHDVIVQLSNTPDFSTRTTVFNNDIDNSAGQGAGSDAEYPESSIGKAIRFAAVPARYVRAWINGSNSNGYNHYVELEVYGSGEVIVTPTMTNVPCPNNFLAANLNGANQVPPVAAGGQGSVQFKVDVANNTLIGNWSIAGLSSAVTAAHIHQGATGVNGPVVIPFSGLPTGSGTFITSTAITSAQLQALLSDPAGFYVNVHTAVNAGGEIRGQLGCAPTLKPTRTPTPSAPNLALNKPVTASSLETPNFPANLAVDGNPATRWSSLYVDPQWIQIDLGAVTNINHVVLRWEAAFGRAYQIQVSVNGTTWKTIYATTNSDGGVDDLTGLIGNGRFIRMYGTARGSQWGYSLWEFEVYGN